MNGAKTVERLHELAGQLDPRWMGLDQALRIYDLVCRYPRPPRAVVEIGTYCGRGAVLLAAMVEPWGGHVTTIDLPWTGRPNTHFTKTADDWAAELGVKNLTIVRRADGAEGWFADWFRALGPRPSSLDLVYLDSGHTWAATAAQAAMSLAALRPGGWLVMDDLRTPEFPDVQLCWDRVVCALVPPQCRFTQGRQGFAMRSAA